MGVEESKTGGDHGLKSKSARQDESKPAAVPGDAADDSLPEPHADSDADSDEESRQWASRRRLAPMIISAVLMYMVYRSVLDPITLVRHSKSQPPDLGGG